MNRKNIGFTLIIPLSLLLSGCPNDLSQFSGETVVSPDGSVTRTTRYVADSEFSVEQLEERYLLPREGAWISGKYTEVSEDGTQQVKDAQIYESIRSYNANEAIPSDFVQPSTKSAKASRNQISVRVRHYWIVDTFQYEERFHDVVTAEGFSSVVHKLYAAAVESAGAGLSQISQVEMTAETAQAKLYAKFDPIIEEFLALFVAKCMSADTTMEICELVWEQSTLGSVLDDDVRFVEEVVAVFPAPPPFRDDEWGHAVSGILDHVFEGEFEEIAEAGAEELVGIIGFDSFLQDAAPIEIRLSLPGEPVTNNAHDHESGTLVWRFEDEDFIYKEHFLHAQSRIIHYDRFVLILIVLLVFLLISRGRTQAH